jgi:hypothetical protein
MQEMYMETTLPKMDLENSPTGCCPVFEPELWDGKTFDFGGLRFLEAETRSFFYMPMNMDKVMSRAQKAINEAGAGDPDRYLMLSEDPSPWKSIHLMLVTADVPGYKTRSLEGHWTARVFEGSFRETGNWYREMNHPRPEGGALPEKILAFYTTCPRCAKAYGKNYVVMFARSA